MQLHQTPFALSWRTVIGISNGKEYRNTTPAIGNSATLGPQVKAVVEVDIGERR
jgi:serine acetyltransferase